MRLGDETARSDMLVNQISWQVGSLQEVRDALDWLQRQGNKIHRIGRDMPGSNWHSYPYDAEGHVNELYYGMEQIGWNLRSKPRAMYDRGFKTRPELPQVSEYEEVRLSEASGVDLVAGHRIHEQWPLDHDVGGVLLARPFKINKIGPVRLWVKDIEREVDCYTRLFGLRITEEVAWQGAALRIPARQHRAPFAGAVSASSARQDRACRTRAPCLSIGLRVGSYQQLRDCVAFLKARGVEIRSSPARVAPGHGLHRLRDRSAGPCGAALRLHGEHRLGRAGRVPQMHGDEVDTGRALAGSSRATWRRGRWRGILGAARLMQ